MGNKSTHFYGHLYEQEDVTNKINKQEIKVKIKIIQRNGVHKILADALM